MSVKSIIVAGIALYNITKNALAGLQINPYSRRLGFTFTIMATFSVHQVIPLLNPQTGIMEVLRAAILLQAKVASPETQDFYFQKGQASHQAKLEQLKMQYAEAAALVNNNDVDFFVEKIAECREKITQIKTRYRLNTIFQIAVSLLNQQMDYYNDLMAIKGRLGHLKPYDELVQDREALLYIFR